MRLLLLLLIGVTPLFSVAGTSHDGENLSFESAYIRGLPPVQKNTAAFGQLKNHSQHDLQLKRIHSPIASTIEVHQHIMDGGTMKMRKVENVSIAAGGTLEFKPGGLHIMMMDVKKMPLEGESVKLEMCFERLCQAFELPVISVLNEKAVHSGHGHH